MRAATAGFWCRRDSDGRPLLRTAAVAQVDSRTLVRRMGEYSNGPSRVSRLTQTVAAISAENDCPCGLHNSYEDLLDEEDDTGIVEQLRANGLVQEAFGTNKCCARLTPQPTCSKCSWCLLCPSSCRAHSDGCCGQVVGTSVLQPTSARPKPRSKAPHRKSDNTRERSFARLG